MKFIGHILLLFTIAVLAFISCSEEDIQVDGVEPYVSITFINQTYLDEIRAEISSINSLISTIDARITGIDTAENRLELQAEKDSLNEVKSALEDDKSIKSSIRSTITGGKLFVNTIMGIPTGKMITNSDSLSNYTIPIDANTTISQYQITITRDTLGNKRIDTLSLSYEVINEFIENQLRAIASNLKVDNSTYDSILVTCRDTTCNTNEAELTIYF